MQRLYAPISLCQTYTEPERQLILVVDNTPAIQDMLSWVLKLQGYQPVCVANGQEALEWIENALSMGQYPIAILLDLLMPVMNGSTFLERLRERWDAPVPIPPILLLTVQAGNYDYLGCNDVLTKPFHIKELSERLERLIDKTSSTDNETTPRQGSQN
ncbi:response regulator [Ktedonosporobacter rubrisoli]|uniref:Response regulator n=1 Tax=Ktedonosporobacter rubrisoli TaxID=2509675 RepID=A0A4P6JSK8_KTERU|nr:response regulator [Ktedonosporobacter rubrisoli]QBD78253.1 response regulator [Ktedonosporobacter rubrisoli]